MQKFKIIGKPLLGEKYVEGRRIMPSLVATTSASTHNVLAHALRDCARTMFKPKERRKMPSLVATTSAHVLRSH